MQTCYSNHAEYADNRTVKPSKSGKIQRQFVNQENSSGKIVNKMPAQSTWEYGDLGIKKPSNKFGCSTKKLDVNQLYPKICRD